MKNLFLKGVIFGTGCGLTLFMFLFAYATWTNINTKNDGDTINSTYWNELVNNINTLGAKVDTLSNIPSGAIMAFNLSSCPNGWIAANGSNSTPDLRGEFIRGLDSGRGVDTGRTLASAQGDAIRNITGSIGEIVGGNINGAAGAFYIGGYSSPAYAGNTVGYHSNRNFDVSRVVPVASENRPRNIALLYCMKQ